MNENRFLRMFTQFSIFFQVAQAHYFVNDPKFLEYLRLKLGIPGDNLHQGRFNHAFKKAKLLMS